MSYKDGLEIIRLANEKEIEEKYYERWIHEASTEMSFPEYKKQLGESVPEKQKEKSDIDIDEIVKKTEKIIIEDNKKKIKLPGRL